MRDRDEESSEAYQARKELAHTAHSLMLEMLDADTKVEDLPRIAARCVQAAAALQAETLHYVDKDGQLTGGPAADPLARCPILVKYSPYSHGPLYAAESGELKGEAAQSAAEAIGSLLLRHGKKLGFTLKQVSIVNGQPVVADLGE
jgi:hypothetical protein